MGRGVKVELFTGESVVVGVGVEVFTGVEEEVWVKVGGWTVGVAE